jgi:hypothetical protein
MIVETMLPDFLHSSAVFGMLTIPAVETTVADRVKK